MTQSHVKLKKYCRTSSTECNLNYSEGINLDSIPSIDHSSQHRLILVLILYHITDDNENTIIEKNTI